MNKQERKEYHQKWYIKNRDIKIKQASDWQKEHPEQAKINMENFRENRKNYWKEYLRKLKHWAVDKSGRKCSNCGLISEFDCIYDFHHLGENSWNKEKQPSNMRTKELIKWRKMNNIPKDCKLLCANCYRIEHFYGFLIK